MYLQFYKQTHKVCNCLEKLLLVTSTASSFGERTGADMSQSKVGGVRILIVSVSCRNEMESHTCMHNIYFRIMSLWLPKRREVIKTGNFAPSA